ncbi:MAG: hypothetical protein ISS72_07090 [Candidatus Brocadiae bacterium]|nr:hypothetical protein [Candidatus Brocadiia bacterium]
MGERTEGWVHDHTLAGQKSPFWWLLDDAGAVCFLWKLRDKEGRERQRERTLSRDELEAVLRFMGDGQWRPRGTRRAPQEEADGPVSICGFFSHTLSRSSSDLHLASYLATVLTGAGLWEWNRRRNGMKFRQVSSNLDPLAAHHERRQAESGPKPPAARAVRPTGRRAPSERGAPFFNLATTFRGRSAELRGQLAAVETGRHGGEKGRRRENVFRDFLRHHLPAAYGVGTGEVVAASGDVSRQVDILIYDALHAPLLLEAGGSAVFAAESIYAAIEVKPLLDRAKASEAVDNIASVKVLPRTALARPWGDGGLRDVPLKNPPIFGAVLGAYAIEPELLARRLREAQRELHPALWIDCICIPEQAVIHRRTDFPGPAGWSPDASVSATQLAIVEAGADSLLYFWLLLNQDLRAKTLHPPDLMHYAHGMAVPEPKIL